MEIEAAAPDFGWYDTNAEATFTVMEVGVHFTESRRAVDLADNRSPGALHAVWGDRCVDVPTTALLQRVYALIGVESTGEISSDYRDLLDFDTCKNGKAGRKLGLRVYSTMLDGTMLDEVKLSLGEFWDLLEEIAKP